MKKAEIFEKVYKKIAERKNELFNGNVEQLLKNMKFIFAYSTGKYTVTDNFSGREYEEVNYFFIKKSLDFFMTIQDNSSLRLYYRNKKNKNRLIYSSEGFYYEKESESGEFFYQECLKGNSQYWGEELIEDGTCCFFMKSPKLSPKNEKKMKKLGLGRFGYIEWKFSENSLLDLEDFEGRENVRLYLEISDHISKFDDKQK